MNFETTTSAPVLTAIPTISSSFVQIDLSISVWTGRKKDKSASEKVVTDAVAEKGAASVIKKLLGDCPELEAVQKFAANARNTHYAMTRPWSDLGMRLCPMTRYPDYEHEMSGLQQEFFSLVEKFLQAYQWEMANAQIKLGALFNPDEYPTGDSLRSKFRFRYVAVPLPEANDFDKVQGEASSAMREQYEKFYGDQVKNVMADVWQSVYSAVDKMSERLDYTDTSTKKIFRDSLVENVLEVVNLLSDFNVTGDADMERARVRLADALQGVTPDALREDAHLRAETKRKVDEVRSDIKKVMDTLPSLGW